MSQMKMFEVDEKEKIIGEYLHDVCPECGEDLKKHKMFDFGFIGIPKAVVHMKCDNCGEIFTDICKSEEYRHYLKCQEIKRERKEKERKISLF